MDSQQEQKVSLACVSYLLSALCPTVSRPYASHHCHTHPICHFLHHRVEVLALQAFVWILTSYCKLFSDRGVGFLSSLSIPSSSSSPESTRDSTSWITVAILGGSVGSMMLFCFVEGQSPNLMVILFNSSVLFVHLMLDCSQLHGFSRVQTIAIFRN